MSERALAHARWPFVAVLLAVPLTLLAREGPPRGLVATAWVALLFAPWWATALGLALRVAAARGLAIGVGLFGVVIFALMAPEPQGSFEGWVLASQASLWLLALPALTPVFGDSPRLRWSAAALALSLLLAMVHVAGSSLAEQRLAGAALIALGAGAVGLVREKTWSLFALFAGALMLAVAPFLRTSYYEELSVPPLFAWLPAALVLAGVAAWVGPVLRAMRSGIGTSPRR